MSIAPSWLSSSRHLNRVSSSVSRQEHPATMAGQQEDFRAVRAAFEMMTRQHPEARLAFSPRCETTTPMRERTPRREPRKPRKPPQAKAKVPPQRQLSPRAAARNMGFFPQRSALAFLL